MSDLTSSYRAMSSNQTQPEEGTALVENPSHTTKVAELQPEDEYYYSKLSLVILAQLSTFMYAGIIFGWSPLLAMFKQEGYYSDECSKSDDLCTAQTDSLETIYTIASVCAEVCAIFVGNSHSTILKARPFGNCCTHTRNFPGQCGAAIISSNGVHERLCR